jgi:hypothetical protein
MLCWPLWDLQWFGSSDSGWEDWVWICVEREAFASVNIKWDLTVHPRGKQAYSYRYLGGVMNYGLENCMDAVHSHGKLGRKKHQRLLIV